MRSLAIAEAESLAAKFRITAGIGLEGPICVATLLMSLGVTAVFRPLSESSYGISCKSSTGRMFMLINSSSTLGRQHFTVAHELYHLYFDEHPVPHICNGAPATGEEKNANRFAQALLMPQAGMLRALGSYEVASHQISLATVLRLEQLFGVSRKTLLIRLKDLGLITQKRLSELDIVPVKESARQYGYDLSLYLSGNEGLVIGDFGEKARLLFEQEKISEGHYIELLNMISDGRH